MGIILWHMQDELIEKARRYIDLQETEKAKQDRLRELQSEMFGEGSEETEKKAREFFSDVGGGEQQSAKTQEIDELRQDLSDLEETLENTREELQELLVDVQFPLNETIDIEDEKVVFPYSDEIPQDVIDAIESVLEEDLSKEEVKIETDAIRVETDDVDGAMDQAMSRIQELRSKANMMVDVEQYVDDINSRDEKIVKTLYVLHKSENPLSKKGIEERIGVDAGDLRGTLYYVLDNDPYLEKSDSEFSLSDMGRRVIEAYLEQHGSPEDLPEGVEA